MSISVLFRDQMQDDLVFSAEAGCERDRSRHFGAKQRKAVAG